MPAVGPLPQGDGISSFYDFGTGAPVMTGVPGAPSMPGGDSGSSGGPSPFQTSSTTNAGPPPSAQSASMQQPGQPPLDQSMANSYNQMINTPVLDPSNVLSQLNNLKINSVDYLNLARQNYQNTVNQLNGIQNNVNSGYDTASQNTGNIFNTDANAATLGPDNILQHIATDEGNAITGSANNSAQALAALKNAELAYRGRATGDWVSDPTDTQAAGLVSNAQNQAANAQAMAGSMTGLNNLMASGMRTQGASMQQQLANAKLAYDASMGSKLADLANQESSREMQAISQNRQEQLQAIMSGWGVAKDAATLQEQNLANMVGNRGYLSGLTDIGNYNMDLGHGNLYNAQSQMGSPVQSAQYAAAVTSNPQEAQSLTNAYNQALGNMSLIPGTQPTWEDVYQSMMKANNNLPAADVANFAQRAQAPKSMPTGTDLGAFQSLLSSQ